MIYKTTCIALLIMGFDFSHALQLRSQTGAEHIYNVPDELKVIIKNVNPQNIDLINWGEVDHDLEKSKHEESDD
jgi:hypothetical protein